jgi:hypothetical protein
MTKQSVDTVAYRGEEFVLCHSSIGRRPFIPEDYGIPRGGGPTDCYRGCEAKLVVESNALYLEHARIYMDFADLQSVREGKGPMLSGQQGQIHKNKCYRDLFGLIPFGTYWSEDRSVDYSHLHFRLPFSGGILIGQELIQGYLLQPFAFCLKQVYELVFDNGKLILDNNCFDAMNDVRNFPLEAWRDEAQDAGPVKIRYLEHYKTDMCPDGKELCICHPSLKYEYPL